MNFLKNYFIKIFFLKKNDQLKPLTPSTYFLSTSKYIAISLVPDVTKTDAKGFKEYLALTLSWGACKFNFCFITHFISFISIFPYEFSISKAAFTFSPGTRLKKIK